MNSVRYASIYKEASRHLQTTPAAPANEASRHLLDGRSHPSLTKEGSSPDADGVKCARVSLRKEGKTHTHNAFQSHIDDVDGAIINPAGFSFSSVALHDVIKAVPFPTIEVHLSNLDQRDQVHRNSIITAAAKGKVMGLGWRSYTAALRALVEMVRESKRAANPVKTVTP